MGIVLAFLTAAAWGFSELQMSRVAKGVGALTATLWLTILGTAGAIVVAPLSGWPEGGGRALAGAAAASFLGLTGIVAYFRALASGQLSVVSPVVALSGGVTAILAVVALGERLSAAVIVGVVVAGVGVVLAAAVGGRIGGGGVGWAVLSALLLGSFTAALRPAGEALGPLWMLLVYRLVMLAVLLPVVATRGELRLPGAVRRPMLIGSACDIVATTALVVAVDHGPVAVVGVVAAQFATVAVVLGATVLDERLRPHQWVGVGMVLGSVALIALAA